MSAAALAVPDGAEPARRAADALVVLLPLVVMVMLAAFVTADPTPGISASRGPSSDEAWDVINARNFVLLGRWSTDDWNLHLVNVPYSIIIAGVFSTFEVGFAQARAVSIVATGLTTFAIAAGLRRSLGSWPAILAAAAFASSTLILYYGRLAFLESSVAWWLTAGALLSLRAWSPKSGRWGLIAGVAFALAIGTKPSAAFAVAGAIGGITIIGRHSPAVRRWTGSAVLVIVAGALLWLVAIGLPQLDAVRADLRIWASEPIVTSPGTMLRRFVSFPIRSDGFLVLAAPLLVMGTVGAILMFRSRASLPAEVRALAGLASGSLVAGLLLLAFAPYRPNRYEVPLLPGLAILGSIGIWTIRAAIASWPRGRVVIASALAVGALCTPGLLTAAGWARDARYSQVRAQEFVAGLLSRGDVVEGAVAPGLALRVPVVTIVSRPQTNINPGDLYAERDVRWIIGAPSSRPAWAKVEASAWNARRQVECLDWVTNTVCIWQLP